VTLDRFFEAAALCLDGRPWPAGGARPADQDMDFYVEAAAREGPRLLEELFPLTRRACARWRPGRDLWPELASAFSRAHGSRHWDPNARGSELCAFLRAQWARGAELPPALDDLADYEWRCHLLAVSPAAFDPARERVNPNLSLQAYSPSILEWVPALAPCGAVPFPLLVCLFRVGEGEVRWLRPSPAELGALALARGEIDAGALADNGLTGPALREAAGRLAELGILGAAQ